VSAGWLYRRTHDRDVRNPDWGKAMPIIQYVLGYILGPAGSAASVITAVDWALGRKRNCTAEELFERCFTQAVRSRPGHLSRFTENHEAEEAEIH